MGVAQKRSRIADHKHCPVCGRAMPVDAQFCSKECRENHESRVKRSNRMRIIFYLLYIALLASLFLFFFRPS